MQEQHAVRETPVLQNTLVGHCHLALVPQQQLQLYFLVASMSCASEIILSMTNFAHADVPLHYQCNDPKPWRDASAFVVRAVC